MIKTNSLAFLSKPLFLIILIALILRLPLLNGSFWLDEAAQYLESARPLSQQLDIIPDFQPPLLHLILHFTLYLSSTEWSLRLIGSVIPGLIALIATYKLAKKLFGNTTANISTFLLATSSFHIYFSQELRPYSLAAMWASLAFLQLFNKITTHQKEKSLKSWLPLIIINSLGLYSSYLYPFVIATQLITIAILNKKILKKALLSCIISCLSFLPFLPIFIKQLQTGQALRAALPGWELVVSHPQLQAIPLTLGKFIFGVINLEINITFISLAVAILICCLILVFFIWKAPVKQAILDQKKWLFLLISIFFSIFLPWIISFWIPVIQPKRVMYVQPLIYIFFSALITQTWILKKTSLKIIGIILLIILFSLNIFSSYQYYTQKSLQREDWRELVNFTKARFPDKKSIFVFGFDEPFAPWRVYAQDHFKTLSVAKMTPNDQDEVQDLLKPIYDYEFVLLFDYLRDLTDPNDQIIQAIESYGYEEIETIDFGNIGFLRVYIKDKELLMSYLE